MKKINLKGLRLTSPRREAGSGSGEDGRSPPLSPTSDSRNETCCSMRHVMCETMCAPRRKRESFFKTLRRKFSTAKKKEPFEDDSRWDSTGSSATMSPSRRSDPGHIRSRSGYHEEKSYTASWKNTRRKVDKPVRSAHSEEGLLDLGFDLQSPKTKSRQPTSPVSPDQTAMVHHSQRGKTRKTHNESGNTSKRSRKQSAMFPFDTEYGHASAPVPLTNGHDVLDDSVGDNDRSLIVNGQIGSDVENFESYESYDPESPIRQVVLPCPVYDQVKDGPKGWCLTKELFKLSHHGWYWGPITRVEAEEKLLNQPDGAFLVRDSSDERYLLSLSFRSYGRTLHTRIEHCNGVFSFYAQPESEGYSSIVDLIEHSMNDSQTGVFCYSRARTPGSPSFPVRLTKPVSRFSQVRSLQYLCRFVIRQFTRVDHIQKLPLPTSIKGWLQENQY